ncbi:hypothetical protein PoB_004030300 [Plakobranchus ocellatus]|uniref:Uncharacterized protein n=1 Tax=Plakobranchus ocellatus TaxID=259542 RepID=A0AAV4B4V3_9GAST|nr:hypothetical protein PoB_004030300 [Plakobranchus ocellatus]
MLRFGSSDTAIDDRCLRGVKEQASVSATHLNINLDPGRDLNLHQIKSQREALLVCSNDLSPQSNQTSAKGAIIHQPLSIHREPPELINEMPPATVTDTLLPSISSINLCSYGFQGSYLASSDSSLSFDSLSRSSSDHYLRKSQDELAVIDGQIVVRDSNVDPVLCRLKRQQLISFARKKESSVASSNLHAERVRFDKVVTIREIDDEEWNEVSL